jgi:hypothetical protein
LRRFGSSAIKARRLGLLQDALGQHVLDVGQVQGPSCIGEQQAGPVPEGEQALGRGEAACPACWGEPGQTGGEGLQIGQAGLTQWHAAEAGQQGCGIGLVGAPGRGRAAIQPQGDLRETGNGLIGHRSLAIGRRLRRVQDKGHSVSVVVAQVGM